MFTVATVLNALELGFIYALVAMALFLSFRVLNIADMTTDGAFTLGCAVSATAAVAGHPFLGLPLAMLAGAAAVSVLTVMMPARIDGTASFVCKNAVIKPAAAPASMASGSPRNG